MDKLRLSAIYREAANGFGDIVQIVDKLGKAQVCLTACMDVSGFATSTV